MSIKVRFDKNGYYHPAFGRLGRGKNAGRVYVLPDEFGQREIVEVEVRDPKTKEVVEVRKKERFKLLPRTAEIIDEDRMEELKDEALEHGEDPPKPIKPRVVGKEHLEKVTGKGRVSTPQSGQERTTGRRASSRRARREAAAPVDAD